MKRLPFALFSGLLLLMLSSCIDCNREACDVYRKAAPTRTVTQGLAGAAVFLSDVTWRYEGGPTCRECIFLNTSLSIWKSETVISSPEDASAICSARGADFGVEGDPWYEVALDVGNYLACLRPPGFTGDAICVPFTVAAEKTTTLHDTSTGTDSVYLSEPGEDPTLFESVLWAVCSLPGAV